MRYGDGDWVHLFTTGENENSCEQDNAFSGFPAELLSVSEETV
jgi:hypothetical protein